MTDPITTALGLLPEIDKAKLCHDGNGNPVYGLPYDALSKIRTALEALQSGEWVAVPRERLASELKLLKRYQEQGSDQSAKNWLIELGVYPLIGAK